MTVRSSLSKLEQAFFSITVLIALDTLVNVFMLAEIVYLIAAAST